MSNPSEAVQILQILAPLIGPLITALIRYFLPTIPKALLPLLATAFGSASATLGGASPELAIALGGSGVAAREIFDQARKTAIG